MNGYGVSNRCRYCGLESREYYALKSLDIIIWLAGCGIVLVLIWFVLHPSEGNSLSEFRSLTIDVKLTYVIIAMVGVLVWTVLSEWLYLLVVDRIESYRSKEKPSVDKLARHK